MMINIRGKLLDFGVPKVMGILNVTPDSFYTSSRHIAPEEIRRSVARMVAEGADMIDVGGCSTRPGYEPPGAGEEWERVNLGCGIVKELAPEIPVSVDTFRAEVARKALDRWQVDIVNDVSGGADPDMWPLVAEKKVVYVLTHNREDGSTEYDDVVANVVTELSVKLNELHRLGVNDVIIDPGFGFAKTLDQNFCVMEELPALVRIGKPLLVGVSRKSMIYKTLGKLPEDSLAGTIALDAIALEKGANILRVHDVREAVDTVKIFRALMAR